MTDLSKKMNERHFAYVWAQSRVAFLRDEAVELQIKCR